MQPTPCRSPDPETPAGSPEAAIAVVHFALKEVEWIRKLSTRLCRSGHERGHRERDLECILELAGSSARAMRQFLDEARSTSPLAPRTAGIRLVIEQAVLQVSRREAMAAFRVDVEEEARDAWVPRELLVALVAVLENAVEFSRDGTSVRIRVRRRHENLEICIEDRGMGMNEQVASACRDRGFTTRGDGRGHGFGLYSASRIVSQNGGEICVDSTPGEGTRVSLTLPFVQRPRKGPAAGGTSLATVRPAAPASDPARHRRPRGSRC